VGDTDIRWSDVERVMAIQDLSDPRKAFDLLEEQALLAEDARREKLDLDPSVQAALRRASDQVLADERLQRVLRPVTEDPALLARYERSREQLTVREVTVAQIWVRALRDATPAQEAAARARAQTLRERIRKGESFESVAARDSDDRATGPKGGRLGAIRDGEVEPSFFEGAFELREGEVSEPIRTPYGFHIIKALAPPGHHLPSFEEAKPRLAKAARVEEHAALLEALRKQIPIREFETLRTDGGVSSAARSAPAAGR